MTASSSRFDAHDVERGPTAPRSVFVTAPDGLRLHVRDHGPRRAPSLPAVCLPGLTRTVEDFDALASLLASASPPRRVIVLDSRGRGLSEYDRNPANYNLAVELGDVIAVLTALEIGPAVFVGSSRGGILTMLLGVAQPTALAGVVLHDIGPAIEPKGLARIKSYVGKLPQPRNFAEGGEILRRLFDAQFPNLTVEQWLAAAQHTWKAAGDALVPTYDVRLAQTLADVDIERPLPALWKEFDALAGVPILLIRGANSDILSAETVAAMREHHPDLGYLEVADQGHVPLLEGDVAQSIAAFMTGCDTARSRLPSAGTNRGVAESYGSQAGIANRRGATWR